MKHSIYKIFKNLNMYLLVILTLSAISLAFIVEQYYAYKKIDNLNNQKAILLNIYTQQEVSNKIDIYLYNGKIANINQDIKKLQDQNQYNYISTFLSNNASENSADLIYLHSLIQEFDRESRIYFQLYKATQANKDKLHSVVIQILSGIDSIVLKNISFDQERFSILSKIILLLFLLVFITSIWYKIRLAKIYKDIIFLHSIDTNKDTKIFTQEMNALLIKMSKKTPIVDNPSMIDPVTEIYNNKGMVQAYDLRKTFKNTNFSSLTVLEIDNFSKSNRVFSEEFTQTILKKVAYIISLHQQSTDIIARSDYNQFTLIFSRPSKEQLYKHTELIRQSISEIKLVTPQKETIHLSVSGGFINKSNHAPLEESIRKAKQLLQNAKELGKNKIIQSKDIPT